MIKILDLKNVNLASLNKKYGGKNPKTGRYFLSKDYKDTQKLIYLSLRKIVIPSPIQLTIFVQTYKDADNLVHAICNTVEKKGIIKNDRDIVCLRVFKKIAKRGSPDSVQVFIETSEQDYNLELDCYDQLSKDN